jgi:filamentous hemagglutinin family protein
MYRVNTGSRTRTRLTLATLVLSSTALTPVGLAAQELPAGGIVSAGDAEILQTTNGLDIKQTSQNAIINWSDFSISAGGSVVFNNGSGATLNRVTGTGISKIDGNLSATGSLYLVNRNGIVIGKDGVISTGGSFIASTLGIKDKDFLDGGNMTFSGENAATIINKGKIGSLGGDVALISRHIRNEGTLEAPEGTVGLAAGREVLLRDAALDDGKFLVRVGDADSSITEAGMINAAHAELRAHGGNIYALAGNKGGAINANGTAKAGGRIFLTAGGGKVRISKPARATRARVSPSSAGNAAGNSIAINADIVSVAGLLQAGSTVGTGGKIDIGGRDISLENASIDVSGATGGGDIRIGGAWQGGDFGALPTADQVSLDEGTLLTASATQAGDGGEVVVWSDSFTRFAGKIEARGADTGKGGDAEVSGKAKLAYSGFTDLSAESGAFGDLLLDPYNVTISDEAGANSTGTSATGDDSIITVATLEAALAGANVEITTSPSGGTGTQAGDILVADDVNWDADTVLTLTADNNIGIFADVTATGTNAGLVLNYGGDYFIPQGASVTLSGTNASLDINGQSYDLIHSMADFAAIASNGRYALAEDLDASGTIYADAVVDDVSSITLHGLGHVISDLTIDSTQNEVGLFGKVRGTLRDFGLLGGSVSGANNTGSLAGFQRGGTVSGVYSSVDVTGSGDNAGGLIGRSWGTVANSFASGSVSGGQYNAGGLVGYAFGRLSNTYATGDVTGATYDVGGLAGFAAADIENSYATGNVTGTYDAGGLVGFLDGSISTSYATGDVVGTFNTGGLVGYARYASIDTSYATGAVGGPGTGKGGLLQYALESTVANSFWDTETTGQSNGVDNAYGSSPISVSPLTTAQARDAGNYSGWDFANDWYQSGDMRPILRSETGPTVNGVTAVSNLHQLALMGADLNGSYLMTRDIDASPTATSNAADIWNSTGWVPVGENGTTPFTGKLDGNDNSIGSLTFARTSDYRQGFFGYSEGTIKDLQLTDVEIEGFSYVGALIARNYGDVSSVSITGSVTGRSYVGGLVANNYGSISNAVFSGSVEGISFYAGGLAADNAGSISNSATSGSVTSAFHLGGLVGYNNSGGTIEFSHSSSDVNGVSNVGGLVAQNVNNSIIRNSYATGDVTASISFGGGSTNRIIAGGLVAVQNAGGVTENSYATGNVSVPDTAASSIYSTARAMAGGLIGRNFGSIVSSFAAGDVDVSSNSDKSIELYVGGLVGENPADGDISIAFASGLVTANAASTSSNPSDFVNVHAGGLVGQNDGNISDAYVPFTAFLNSSAGVTTGTESYNYVGSLVGNNSGSISRTHALGNATASAHHTGAALLAGKNSGTISASFGQAGSSIVENNSGTLIDVNSYSTAQLQDTAFILASQTPLGWDFDNVWIPPSSGYLPELYALSPVIWVEEATTTSTYGEATGTVTSVTSHGGPMAYVFGSVGDALDLTGATVSVDPTTNAGTSSGSLTNQNIFEDSDEAVTYRVFYHGASTRVVEKANLTITASDDSKIYGQTASLTGYSVSGLISANGDSVTSVDLASAGAASTADAGSYDIFASNAVGNRLDNYAISYADGALTVDKAALTITASDASKTYGQTASLTGYSVSGLVAANGDAVTNVDLTSAGAASTADAGSYDIVASNAAGNRLGNYTITYADGTLTVDKAALTITASDDSKTYGDNASLTGYTVSGLVAANGDSVTGVDLASAGAASTADAGSYDIVASNASGNRLNNYDISYADGALTVDKAALLITASDDSKTYGDNASLTGYTVSGLVAANGDSVTGVDLASAGAASTADAGSYGIVASNASGNRLDNYTISYADGTLTVDKAALTITASDASKTYGQTASLTGYSVSGLVAANGDSLTGVDLASAAAASTADAGSYDIVASNASGNRLGNYTISYADGTLTVDKAALLITASDASKTYGQTASLTGYSVSGLVAANGDTVTSVDLASPGAASTADAGSYDIVASNASGNRLDNYTISYADGTLTVDKAALTITASDATKTYGQTGSLTGYTVSGLVAANGDSVTGVDLASAGAASTADAGSYDIVASNASGNRLGNYTITYADGTLTVDKAALTITANDASKTYGQTASLTGYSVSGLVSANGDSVTGVDLASAGAASTADAGIYDIVASNATGNRLNNYTISYADGTLTVDKAALEVKADEKVKLEGAVNPPLTWSVTGGQLFNGDSLNGALYTTADENSSPASYAIAQGTLNNTNYMITFLGGVLLVEARSQPTDQEPGSFETTGQPGIAGEDPADPGQWLATIQRVAFTCDSDSMDEADLDTEAFCIVSP